MKGSNHFIVGTIQRLLLLGVYLTYMVLVDGFLYNFSKYILSLYV